MEEDNQAGISETHTALGGVKGPEGDGTSRLYSDAAVPNESGHYG